MDITSNDWNHSRNTNGIKLYNNTQLLLKQELSSKIQYFKTRIAFNITSLREWSA